MLLLSKNLTVCNTLFACCGKKKCRTSITPAPCKQLESTSIQVSKHGKLIKQKRMLKK